MCVGGGALCVCVWGRGEVLGDEGERPKPPHAPHTYTQSFTGTFYI